MPASTANVHDLGRENINPHGNRIDSLFGHELSRAAIGILVLAVGVALIAFENRNPTPTNSPSIYPSNAHAVLRNSAAIEPHDDDSKPIQGQDQAQNPHPNPTQGQNPEQRIKRFDLSSFPVLEGELEDLLGSADSYIPPVRGESFRLDLKSIDQLIQLQFGRAGAYIALPGKLAVESIKHRENGEFESLRLAAVSPEDPNCRVVIDVRSYPAIPGPQPNLCTVWIVIERDGVTRGAALIECHSLGDLPTKPQ